MPNLIDTTFFVGEINIPNTSKPEVAESLELFIAKYEEELLLKLLGYELYKAYKDDPSERRFTDLVSGTKEWRGLVYAISPTVDGSLIAYYVYTWWLKDKHVWNSGVGTVRAKGDATEVMPISLKMTEVWNMFSHQVTEFCTFMEVNKVDYPEWSNVNLWQFRVINEFDI